MQLPNRFLERMKEMLGGEYEALLASYDLPHYRGVRINTLKLPVEKAAELGLPLESVPFAQEGFRLLSDAKAGASPYYHAGAFYSQEPSAMSAVTALDPQPGEYILDMCAAPGGKSTQIAARIKGKGVLWCNEYVRSRANVLISNLERCAVRNAVVTSMRPDALAEKTGTLFDRVLVDAPCSGEGMFRREEAAVRDWSEENVLACARRQAEILDSAAKCLKPGGVLVYSTCTFSVEENERNIEAFLQRHEEFTLESIPAAFGRNGFSLSDSADLGLTRRIFPMDGGEGHFVARMRKSAAAADENIRTPQITESKDSGLFRELYGECFSDAPDGVFAVYGECCYLLTPEMVSLPVEGAIRTGLLVGKLNRGRVEPAHAAFMAAQPADCRRAVSFAPDSSEIAAFLHGEVLDIGDKHNGFTAVYCGDIVTGYGKASGGRLKNHYPKGLRTLY